MTVGTQDRSVPLKFVPPIASKGWTDERIAFLREQWINGRSAGEIAALLGGGFSRNAVIGKVHRLGLSDTGRISRPAPKARTATPRPAKAPSAPKPPKPKRPERPANVVASLGSVPTTKGVDYKLTPATEEQVAACRRAGMDMISWVESGCGVESPNARTFADASPSLCRWPLAGGLFCCNPKARGQYCSGHAAVGYEGEEKARSSRKKNSAAYIEGAASWLTKAERTEGRLSGRMRSLVISPWDAGRQAA